MADFLLDTNVISELTKPLPNSGVIAFLENTPQFWLSPITLHELEYGLNLIPVGKRHSTIKKTIDHITTTSENYIVPIQHQEALIAADFRAKRHKTGKTLHLADSLIASTAFCHHLTLVTRNTKDFEGLDIAILNPWQES